MNVVQIKEKRKMKSRRCREFEEKMKLGKRETNKVVKKEKVDEMR